MTIDRLRGCSAALLGLLLVGCGERVSLGQHDPHDHAVQPHVISHWVDDSELFVEFAPLVRGQPVAMAAHFTQLSDFQPVRDGVLEVQLSGTSGPMERFVVRAPHRAGVFRPTLIPRSTGERQLSFLLSTGGVTTRHDVGKVQVYSDLASARQAPANPAPAGDVVMLKEAQWALGLATEAVRSEGLRASVSASAVVRAAADGEFLISASSAGQIVAGAGSFPVVGMAVERDQVLAMLIPRLGGDTDLSTLSSAVQEARVAAQLASSERLRLEALLRAEAVSLRRVEAARAAEQLAQVRLQAAQQRRSGRNVGAAEGGVALRAPMSGLLAAIHVSAGASVSEGAALFHIVDRRSIWLEARIAEHDAARLKQPSGAEFAVPGMVGQVSIEVGRNGRLVGIGGLIDPISRTLPVIFALDDPAPHLPLNQRVAARVFTDERVEMLTVPTTAVLDEAGQRVVYVQRSGEGFSRVVVTLGTRDGDRLAVLDGLRAGDRVVSHGALQVRLAAATPEAMGHGHAH